MIYTLGARRVETAGDDCYVAPSAQVIGTVRLGRGASVWFNCVLRADSGWIILGDGTNVQDGTIIHADEGVDVRLGREVTVGHGALLHGCTIGDSALIGNRAIVLDGAQLGEHCLVAAGALVPPNKVIPARSVVMGAPGKIVREVRDQDLAMMRASVEHYRERQRFYRTALAVDSRSVNGLEGKPCA